MQSIWKQLNHQYIRLRQDGLGQDHEIQGKERTGSHGTVEAIPMRLCTV